MDNNFFEGFNLLTAAISSSLTALAGLIMWRFKYRKVKREDIKDERDNVKYLLEEVKALTNDLIEGKIEDMKQKEIIIELETQMKRIRKHCAACYDGVISKMTIDENE